MSPVRPLIFSLLCAQLASGFVAPSQPKPTSLTSKTTQIQLLPPDASTTFVDFAGSTLESSTNLLSLLKFREISPEEATGQFFFFFFAGSGAGGIGLSQIPKVYGKIQSIRAVANDGPTEGGPSLPANPAVSLFYPKPISQSDVRKIIAKSPAGATINNKGTSTSYPAAKGYVVQEDFLSALKQCNPLASYAVFEAITGGKSTVIAPDEFDAKMAEYKKDSGLQKVAQDLQNAALSKLSAYLTLAVLLFITFDLIVETGKQAFG